MDDESVIERLAERVRHQEYILRRLREEVAVLRRTQVVGRRIGEQRRTARLEQIAVLGAAFRDVGYDSLGKCSDRAHALADFLGAPQEDPGEPGWDRLMGERDKLVVIGKAKGDARHALDGEDGKA